MKFIRDIQKEIEKNLFKNKVIIVFGPRRVGKTTLCRDILKKFSDRGFYINCELLPNQKAFSSTDPFVLKNFFGEKKFVVLDEAQKIENIGLVLKILADTHPEIQIIASGSSSFDLAHKVSEPLTGRSRQYFLYPLSAREMLQKHNPVEFRLRIENILRYGSYPSVFGLSYKEAREELIDISSNYLYKDIFEFGKLKKPNLVIDLLRALALQIGSEVSLTELSRLLKQNVHTVSHYLEMLEKSFIVFRLRSLSRNLRKELARSFKVYFYDLGIRNSLIQNHNELYLRSDVGALWENFCVLERMKKNNNKRVFANYYFWRTYDQKEIDFIEEREGKLFAFEFKWGEEKKKAPKEFLNEYKGAEFSCIHPDNFLELFA